MTADQVKRQLLRHFLATLAYRATKIFHDAPDTYPTLDVGNRVRKPLTLMAHINLLLNFTNRLFNEKTERLKSNRTRTWEKEVQLFYKLLKDLDDTIAQGLGPEGSLTIEQIFQGPIIDAMTHVGQLATLRRMAGSPIKGENYWKANIKIGQVGPDQPLQKK
jgi:hypothetical protein